jgi:hypothetical protein
MMQEVREAEWLGEILGAAPALEVLELRDAGPVLTRRLTEVLAAERCTVCFT